MPKTKICTRCNKRKVLKHFYRNIKTCDNHTTQCKSCILAARAYTRRFGGVSPRNSQIAGDMHRFPCGCVGILPKSRSNNQFACRSVRGFMCRVSSILLNSQKSAYRKGYTAMALSTPHNIIRQMMSAPECVRCQQPISWSLLSKSTTPHLHHNHETGEIYGFTHARCNPLALEQENDRLRAQLKTVLSYHCTNSAFAVFSPCNSTHRSYHEAKD